jgi:NitT/TauT family transport system permease protein
MEMKKFLSALNKKLSAFYILAAIVVLWEIAPRVGWVNKAFLPPFSRVLTEAWGVPLSLLLFDILVSLERIFIGFAIAALIAVPLGFILAGAFPKAAKFLNSLMSFLSQIPPFILFPVFVVVFGVGLRGVYTVIIWSVFWPILFTTINGIKHIDPMLVKCARSMNINKAALFSKVVIPGALPSIMTGARAGMTMGFMMLIGAESLGASSGLGYLVTRSQQMALVPRIFLAALLVAIVGLAVNYLFEWLEKRIVVWKDTGRQELI